MATSAVTLSLTDEIASHGPDRVRDLVLAALEAGVNSYHVAGCDPNLAATVGEALAVVERRLLCVSMRLGLTAGRMGTTRDFSPEAMTAAIDHGVNASGLDHLDFIVLDEPGMDELSRDSLEALKAARASGRVGLLGVSGANDAMDAYISTNAFDVLVAPYHLRSGWKERNRLKAAVERDMGIVAYGWFPEEFATLKSTEAVTGKKTGFFGGFVKAQEHPLQGMGTYQFLHKTMNWTAEEICLSYALTEPALATVLIEARDVEHLNALAAVPEREMPPGLAAQVEMARFAPIEDREAS
jgi:aryl-alcohol dehydrogenase-like predicted oxidoreductase